MLADPSVSRLAHSTAPAADSPPAPNAAQIAEHGGLVSRRAWLTAGGLAAATAASASSQTAIPPHATDDAGGGRRREEAFRVRLECAWRNRQRPFPAPRDNGDEERYPDRIASFSKGLPHDRRGEPDRAAYEALLRACRTERMADFEAVPSGTGNLAQRNKLVNPMAGVDFDLEGMDSHQFAIRPAPAFASAEEAGEIAENYWMALLRDVPFEDYATHALAGAAAADLTRMADFRGPKRGGQVTPGTLFRAAVPGGLVGPYVSQFFWLAQPFGAQFVEPRIRATAAGSDDMTTEDAWLAVQNGTLPASPAVYDPVRRYIRNGRDLGEWVHIDVLFQAYFQAMLALLHPPKPSDPERSGLGCPLNPGNPYRDMRMQVGFGTFGGPYIATLMCEVATRALKAVWYQKWFVHRRLRPEEFAARVHGKLVHGRAYPIHADILGSPVLAETRSRFGSLLLPQAFPEGCPVHPAYGAGHATVAGACTTILKAVFDEGHVIPQPMVASADGLSLLPYQGQVLTVGGELNKLAANVAIGRNIAGVHWRSDASESLVLGEELAISVLRDQRLIYREPFTGFTFTRFDGSTVTV